MRDYQQEILNWLKDMGPSLAELYEGAVKLLTDNSFPGRVRFIAHAVREIRNRLPEVVAGKIVRPRQDYLEELKPIIKEWEATQVFGVVARDEESEQRLTHQQHSIPGKLLLMIEQFFKKHQDVSLTKKEKAKALLLELAPESGGVEESLIPVIDHWLDITEWFVERAHESPSVDIQVDENTLVEKFGSFEQALRALVGLFYSGLEEIEDIVKKANSSMEKPSCYETERAVGLLMRPQYRDYFFQKLENPHWLAPLKDRKFFDTPPELIKDEKAGTVSYPYWVESAYLKHVASKVPLDVLEIINNLKTENPYVKKGCIDALLEMPEDDAVKGVSFACKASKQKSWHEWFFVGRPAAKLMVKLAEKHIEEAFKIAWALLEVWKPTEDSRKSIFNDITAKFAPHEYNDLVFKYYRKLWDIDAAKATVIFVKTFDRYLTDLNKAKGFDVSSHFYITVERLDQIDRVDRDLVAVLVSGICEARKAVIEKQPEKVDELLDYLRDLKKHIFERVEMYLLRFVPAGTYKNRISEIIKNKKFLETPGYEYEYKLLLRDKFEDVDSQAKKAFEDWIKSQDLDDEDKKRISEWFKEREGRDATDKDFETIENSRKAKALYLVKERFSELYKESKTKAQASDEELRPKPRMSTGRWISPTEGSPINPAEMSRMQSSEVIEYIVTETWKDKKQTSFFHTPQEGLEGVFKEDVQQRTGDYAVLKASELIRLKPNFLSQYFYGIENALREKKVENANLESILKQAIYIVKDKEGEKDYRGSFQGILEITREIFDNEALKEAIVKTNYELIWGIIEPLTKYDYNPDVIAGDDTDPHTECINCVQGQAFQLVVRFGLICKNEDADNYRKIWSDKIREVLTYITDNVKTAKTICVFGVWFPQLHWLEEEWIEENLEKVFDTKNNEIWNAVWGSYMSWSRPYKKPFEFLVKRGKYSSAIKRIGSPVKYRYGKDPVEGLVEHLMIAFFNGWIRLDDDLLKKFFDDAPAKVRGQAALFLTTGFKHLKKNPDKSTSDRLKEYWEMRLGAIAKEPRANTEESVEFVAWVKDSPIDSSETFDLIYRTLELTDGKIGEGRSGYDFLEGVCDIAEDNELKALRCLNKAMSDRQMGMHFSLYEENLTKFMNSITELPDNYPSINEIRKEAISLANAYGKMGIHKLRPAYERLMEKEKKSEK